MSYYLSIFKSRTPQKRTKKRRDYDSDDDDKIEETEGKCPYKYMIDRQTNSQQKTDKQSVLQINISTDNLTTNDQTERKTKQTDIKKYRDILIARQQTYS